MTLSGAAILPPDGHPLVDYGIWWVTAAMLIHTELKESRKSVHLFYSAVWHLMHLCLRADLGAFPALGLNFRKRAELFWHKQSAM